MFVALGAFILLSLTSACHWLNFEPKKNLTLDAPSDVELVLYRQSGLGDQKVLTPVALLKGGESVAIEPGDYMLANECSGYSFKQSVERVTKIPVRRLSLILNGEPEAQSGQETDHDALSNGLAVPDSNAGTTVVKDPVASTRHAPLVHSQCRDPLDGQKSEWTSRREFVLLPGDTELKIAGKPYQVENFGETSENISIDLYPVKILSEFATTETRFYITATDVESKSGHPVIGVPANESTWLLPGHYSIEVNGSRKKLSIEKGAITEVSVGVIRVEIPGNFPIEQRLKAGGQPVFVYLDGGALLNPDTDYVVFPGVYTVSIEGSEVQESFEVLEGKRTLVKTFAARIDAPPCPTETAKCKRSPPITIHKEQKPYALMTVDSGLPFLLLEGSFEYGVEGMRGIKKSLTRRGDKLAGETLARVIINWQLRPAQGRYRTELVRLESKGSSGFGKSLDLLFHKPEEILVPAGAYDLTYFLGDPLLERSKSKQSLLLEPGQTREVTVPVYIGTAESVDNEKLRATTAGGAARKTDKGTGAPTNPAISLPKKLVPLRR
jgi:hypothetical protein